MTPEDRRYRARWWRVIIAMLAVFWLAVVCGIATSCTVWTETVFGENR